MSSPVVKLALAASLLGVGGLCGAALTARPDPAPAVKAAAPPVEVRTIVKRRTIHVYRKPKRRPTPVVAAPAPAPAAAPAPVRASAPLVTRTSAAGGGEHEREHEDEDEGGDD